ncbi:protein kinase [Streptomyces sp. NPDC048172]|uniref:protein kinase domain-containing protein n=1 Tax=Streptomyces sp. NPDC048172 TaxID=3365505 RepID=UPI00372077D8
MTSRAADGTGRPWRPGERIDGRYEVTRLLGRGGMGAVHQVRHLDWDTELAVKSPLPEVFAGTAEREAFVAEAERWVSLGLHPHVCACYYVRTLDGVPRVFAEYVAGGSLHDWITEGRLYAGEPDEALARILDVAVQMAWGLGHAHWCGLVHQDVKPANVLVDADGAVKVTDFGLARAFGAASAPGISAHAPHGGLMTREYASPEQLAGEPLGRRTDLYSYAVCVLEMFTGGRTWLIGSAAGDALAEHLADGADATGDFGDGDGDGPVPPPMPEGVAGLLAACLEHDPRRRPGSAAEVAERLTGVHRELTGRPYPRQEPVEADLRADELNNRALSLVDLGQRREADEAFGEALEADPQHPEARYNSGLRMWRASGITDETLLAALETVRANAENAADPAPDPGRTRLALAEVHLERGDHEAADGILGALADERPDDPDLRRTRAALGRARDALPHRDSVREVPWQTRTRPGPDDETVVRLTPDARLAVTGERDGTVRLWDAREGRCVRTFEGHTARVHSVDITPNARYVISAGRDDTVRLWDVATGTANGVFQATVWSLRLSPREPVAVCSLPHSSELLVVDLESGKPRRVIQDRERPGTVELSPDGRFAVVGGWAQSPRARVWDLTEGRLLHELAGDGGKVVASAFSADGRYVATAKWFGVSEVWDLGTGRCVRTLRDHDGPVTAVALSADGRWLVTGGGPTDGAVRLWDLPPGKGRCLRTARGHAGAVSAVHVDPDAGLVLSAGQDSTVRAWTMPGGHLATPRLSRPRRHERLARLADEAADLVGEAETALARGARADALAALAALRRARELPGHERSPRVREAWRALGRLLPRTAPRGHWAASTYEGFVPSTTEVHISADGRTGVECAYGREVTVRDLRRGTVLRELAGHTENVLRVRLSPDGTLALSTGRDGTVRLWRTGTGECLRVLELDLGPGATGRDRHGPDADWLRFTADGAHALIGGVAQGIARWDLSTGARTPTGIGPAVPDAGRTSERAHLTDDGGFLARATPDGTVRVWDVASGRRLRTVRTEGYPGALCLSPDGRLLLTAHGGTLRLRNLVSGNGVREFEPREPDVRELRIGADGRYAVSGGLDLVCLWDLERGECVRVLDDQKGAAWLETTPDMNYVLSAPDGKISKPVTLWELDWELGASSGAGPR